MTPVMLEASHPRPHASRPIGTVVPGSSRRSTCTWVGERSNSAAIGGHPGALGHEQIEQELPALSHLPPIIIDGTDICQPQLFLAECTHDETSPDPPRGHRRLPGHGRDPARGRRRRVPRSARPPARLRLRPRRPGGRGRRAHAAARPHPRRLALRPSPRRRRRRQHRPPGPPVGRGRRAPRRDAAALPHPRARARVPRRGRGDPRAARRRRPRERLRALDHRSGRPGGHLRLCARPELRPEGRAPADDRRRRAAGAGAAPAARPAGRAAGAQAHPRRRRVGRPEAAARVLPAQADGLDPQGARRRRRVRGRGVPAQDRRGRDARRRPRAGRARGRPARADGRVHRRVLDDPHLPRLADRRAVVEAQRRAARPRARPRGARRRPRRPRRRQGADHRVPGGAQAARRPRRPRRPPLRRHPDADRPSGHRQDVDRRVDRPRHRPRVRAHVARRRARRGRDPRPPPHLHRRPAGAAGARPARRRAR